MNETDLVPDARYLLQIHSKGEWNTVAYLNNFEEVKRTMEKVPALRVIDTWHRAEVRFRTSPNPLKRIQRNAVRQPVRPFANSASNV